MRFALGCVTSLLLASCLDPVCDSFRWECGGPDAQVPRRDTGSPALDGSADGSTPAPDAGSPPRDAGTAADASASFCEGPDPKVQLGGVVSPIAVTGSQVFLNCCDGAELVFHTAPAFGDPSQLLLTQQGGFALGAVVIGDDPKQPLDASLSVGASYFGSGMSAAANRFSGTLTLTRGADPGNDPLLVRACLTLAARGDRLDGARIYAPAARVLAYGWSGRFALYLLADSTMDATAAAQRPVGELGLATSALLDLNGIRYYRQADAFLALTLDASPTRLKNQLGTIPLRGKPFVVVADGKPIYLGAFWNPVSSLSPALPFVPVDALTDQGVAIQLPPGAPDPRSDPRILSVLAETGKLAP